MYRSIIPIFLMCMTAIASPLRVIDGDTITAIIEVHSVPIWLNGTVVSATFLERIRVLGVNSPERAARVPYEAAKSFTATWLGCANPGDCKAAKTVTLCADKYDDFGRVLSPIKREDGHDLTTDLISSGNGVKFP